MSKNSLKLFVVVLMVWLVMQVIVWGFAELVLAGSRLESALGLADINQYLKVLVYTLFPLPFAVAIARRVVTTPNA